MLNTLKSWLKQSSLVRSVRGLPPRTRIYVVASTHGTVSGWLVPFQAERNYVVNNHVDHLRHLAQSPDYSFGASEVPNLIALKQLRPDMFEELRKQVSAGRAEFINAFFLESAINLTMGETLMRMGIEGLRWYRDVCKCEPKFAWLGDVVGVHAQMPAIVEHLGLEALVYSRNCMGSTVHWWESASGAKTLAISLGRECYINWRILFLDTEPFEEVHAMHLHKSLDNHLKFSPPGLPVLWMVAGGDYGQAPLRLDQVERLKGQWERLYPDIELIFDKTPSHYLRETRKKLAKHDIPTTCGDNLFSYNAFWVNNPTMKQAFRTAEARLLSFEREAALLSAAGRRTYPSQTLQDAWHLLFLNSDRALLWGIGSGDAFYGDVSWTARDRFDSIEKLLASIAESAHRAAEINSYFSPHAGVSAGPVRLQLPSGKRLVGIEQDAWRRSEAILATIPEGMGFSSAQVAEGETGSGDEVELPEEIITPHYRARISAATGDLVELTLPGRKPLALISGPANRLRFETQPGLQATEDFIVPRSERQNADVVEHEQTKIRCFRDGISLVVEATDRLTNGGSVRRRLRFFENYPLIDAEVEMVDAPDGFLISLDFPLATAITKEARAVPFGFSERDPRLPNLPPDSLLMADHAEHGTNANTLPALGWSWHGNEAGLGIALLDRGVPGRESHAHTASLLLMNTSAGFRGKANKWLSGVGNHLFTYSIVPTSSGWRSAQIPHHAAMLNMPLRPAAAEIAETFIRASNNLLVQSVRREGNFLEIRLVECYGEAGTGSLAIGFDHRSASRGTALKPLTKLFSASAPGGVTEYDFNLAAQEILTLRFEVAGEAINPPLLETWDELVPEAKRAGLLDYNPSLIGHPPE